MVETTFFMSRVARVEPLAARLMPLHYGRSREAHAQHSGRSREAHAQHSGRSREAHAQYSGRSREAHAQYYGRIQWMISNS